VLRKAACPVLTVPPGAEESGERAFGRVLCATDFSEPSEKAVLVAIEIAAKTHAHLVLAHVVEWPFGRTRGADAVSELSRSLEETAREQLARAVAGRPIPVEPVVAIGEPKREIVTLAEAQAADLIVLGVSGRGAINLALLGSTAHYVIREGNRPVLTVRG
jgi:nucleotide-binding universal stress UspA family protein